jgi:hypothetical protein
MSITLHLSDEPELPASEPAHAPEPRAPRGHGKHQMSAATLKAMASGSIPGLLRGESWQSARHYSTCATSAAKENQPTRNELRKAAWAEAGRR